MPSGSTIFLIAALLCAGMVLVLRYFMRSELPGIHAWALANLLGGVAFVMYAFGDALSPLFGYVVTNGVYAAAVMAMLAGFLRFFGRPRHGLPLAVSVLLSTLAVAYFYYIDESFAGRTVVLSLYSSAVAGAIAWVIWTRTPSDSGKRRSSYPYRFTLMAALVVAAGHLLRAGLHFFNQADASALLQPSPWNLAFISAGTAMLPALTLGAVMLVHDVMLATAENAANRDFLTNAWSRRAFFSTAEIELARARRSHRSLSLLMFDIDYFKSINDRFGHAAGDEVLVNLVRCAEQVIRNVDYLGRIGGEEFAVLLPDTGLDEALEVAERLRAGLQVDADRATEVGVSVSIGVATLQDGESLAELMWRADAALYRAKLGGRNRVEREAA